jgi:hypothetical protein
LSSVCTSFGLRLSEISAEANEWRSAWKPPCGSSPVADDRWIHKDRHRQVNAPV